MAADLTKKATLGQMQRVQDTAEAELERAGREPTTNAGDFEGRTGFDPGFLNGWEIQLPLATGSRAADMLNVRRGVGQGKPELKYQHFSVIMSKSRRLPMLTAANIEGTQSRSVPRIKSWYFDGRLDKEDQWGDALYDHNALDRGHMVRREDPVWGDMGTAKRANRDTFHFTNSCPQIAGVNQQTWLGLENYILHNARADGMRVSVFTGPFFSDDDLEYRGARVPLAFWKVVAIVTEEGRPSATAYKVSQARELEELEFVYAAYRTFQISIRQVIDATNLDFSALVPYDGFSEHESTSGTPLIERLDTLSQIRV